MNAHHETQENPRESQHLDIVRHFVIFTKEREKSSQQCPSPTRSRWCSKGPKEVQKPGVSPNSTAQPNISSSSLSKHHRTHQDELPTSQHPCLPYHTACYSTPEPRAQQVDLHQRHRHLPRGTIHVQVAETWQMNKKNPT